MTQPNILAGADHADALMTAKRAKNVLFVVLMLMLLIELALFFVGRYSKALDATSGGPPWPQILQYVIGLIDFLGLILPTLLGVVLLLILGVMLVARVMGVARLTSAFLWCVLLALLLFPWQAMLNNPVNYREPTAVGLGLKLPGVLYTWTEFNHAKEGVKFDTTSNIEFGVLKWARFVVFPIIAILILLLIQAKSDRGLRQALGTDTEVPPETTPPVVDGGQ